MNANKTKPKVAFMGTPEFATHSLQALLDSGYPVVAVITKPDKPKGRGLNLVCSPVKQLAIDHGLNILQPPKITDEVLDVLRKLSVEIIVVSAFGQILKKEAIALPPFGCINVHPSLLPKYRGAAPINWTLINGETTTGVTIMRMDTGVDTGDIIIQREEKIIADEDAGSLQMRLAKNGAQLLLKALASVIDGEATYKKQDDSSTTYAPRIVKNDCAIDWNRSAEQIVNFVRGLSPLPTAYTVLDGKVLKIYSAKAVVTSHSGQIGSIWAMTDEGLPIAVTDGFVYLQEIQQESKKRMSIIEFIRGHTIRSTRIDGY